MRDRSEPDRPAHAEARPEAGPPTHDSPRPPGPEHEALAAARRQALIAKVARRIRANAEIVVPAVPALVDHYLGMLADQFAGLGRAFTPAEIASLRALLLDKLEEGFRVSPYSNVFIRYSTAEPPSVGVSYGVAAAYSSMAAEYAYWVATREPPLFGTHPDAKLLEALRAEGVAPGAAILDVGAGTGRNSLALARLGYRVSALEPTPALADLLEADATSEALAVTVIRADVIRDDPPLAGDHAFAVVAEVTSHFRAAGELRTLFERLARALAPGGLALVNVFVAVKGYEPDPIARELAQVLWSTFFTQDEVDAALANLPFAIVSDEDACAFERAHLPEDAWPPTSWYEGWASGHDVFGAEQGEPPISLRWLLYRKTG